MTKLQYLNDTYLFESTAHYIGSGVNERGSAIFLDTTIFYPQGGGQPSDTGEIVSDSGAVFVIHDVRLDVEGNVWHFGAFREGDFGLNERVSLKIDSHKRLLNARIHTAGHLLDYAVSKIDVDNFFPTKGYHFSDGPYVEYEGVIGNPIEFLPILQETIDELILQDIPIIGQSLSAIESQKLGITVPLGKSARVIGFVGGTSCGCGGTHVGRTSEIGSIIIQKIKSSHNKTKISYEVVVPV